MPVAVRIFSSPATIMIISTSLNRSGILLTAVAPALTRVFVFWHAIPSYNLVSFTELTIVNGISHGPSAYNAHPLRPRYTQQDGR
ncbi:hypothetical protein EON65_16125 [archaeon]|nr:MAG: hypothetical protein EON65_16125 [archaeon]